MEEEVRRKDEHNINLVSELELLKEQNQEIQTRTTETMSSLLRDLSDMGMAVNPEAGADLSPKKVEHGVSMLSIFESHWQDQLVNSTHFSFYMMLISIAKVGLEISMFHRLFMLDKSFIPLSKTST